MGCNRLANLLIDATDLIVGAETPEDGWHAINTMATRIGAHAVNALALPPGQIGLAWGWSSMDPDWIEEYFATNLMERDPLFQAISVGDAPELLTKDDVLRPGERNSRDDQFHDGLRRRDYNHFCCHVWPDGSVNKLIMLVCDRDPTDLFGPGTDRAFRSVSAVLATGLASPADSSVFPNRVVYRPLSPREHDVLAYLAHGLSEDDIGRRLGLSIYDLRQIQATASRKMGAATSDQTVAMAMARGLIDL